VTKFFYRQVSTFVESLLFEKRRSRNDEDADVENIDRELLNVDREMLIKI
jgi:hypothetical protein